MRLLIVFLPHTGRIVAEVEFADADREASIRTRFAAERIYGHVYEVVVLCASSREAMRRTHGRYFAHDERP